MKSDFIKCGAAGWCLEILWTGLHALGNREWKMMGAVFSLDVSHLWHGRLYWPFVTAFEENSHYLPGRDLHDWNFCRRIRNRYVFETL